MKDCGRGIGRGLNGRGYRCWSSDGDGVVDPDDEDDEPDDVALGKQNDRREEIR